MSERAAARVAAFRVALGDWEPWLGAIVAVPAEVRLGGHGPLAGMALGVKELIAVEGLPRRSGAPGLLNDEPQPSSAPVVERLVAAGATVVATTATHQLAYGIVTPATRNPRAPGRIAGGSSGGSAAALAAGLVDVALGTDTGGSIRIPAACCGVVGLKTTHGLLPVDGVQPLAPSLDSVGPMARDVATCAAAFRALLAPRPGQAVGAAPGPPLRVGLVRELESVGLDDVVRATWRGVVRELEGDGAEVVRVALPLLPHANAANGRVIGAEALEVHRELLATHPGPQGWAPDVRNRLERARDLDPEEVTAARALGERWRAQLRDVFSAVDVLVTPALPCRVPEVGANPVPVAGRPQPITAALTRLSNPWNLAGVPAGVVPAGTDKGGVPVAVQIVGPWGAEERVLAAMAAVERLRGGPPSPGDAQPCRRDSRAST